MNLTKTKIIGAVAGVVALVVIGVFMTRQVEAVDTTIFSSAGDGDLRFQVNTNDAAAWDAVHDATNGSGMDFTATSTTATTIQANTWDDGGGDETLQISRSFIPFDTSTLPDNATITAVTLELYVTAKINEDNDGDDWINIYLSTQASESDLTVEDFDTCGDAIDNPTKGAADIDIGNINTTAYNTWTFNATGRGWISKTGFTKLCIREGHDAIDSQTANGTQNRITISTSEEGGTSQDPKITVTYTVPTGDNIKINSGGGININSGGNIGL